MILLITGASHTGKTLLASRLTAQTGYSCLSLDLLKMGLIRSGYTSLSPEEDEKMTAYLWPIVREMIRTAIENRQNLIVEGVYIPLTWRENFTPEEQKDIRFCCLVMTRRYIQAHFADIRKWASVVERRLEDSSCTLASVLEDNARFEAECRRQSCEMLMIDGEYEVDWNPLVGYRE